MSDYWPHIRLRDLISNTFSLFPTFLNEFEALLPYIGLTHLTFKFICLVVFNNNDILIGISQTYTYNF